MAVGLLALAGVLIVLGKFSALFVTKAAITSRFFGIRSTTVKFAELESATLGMAFPSISYAITLTDRMGRKALVHANWWRDEALVIEIVSQALVEFDVPMGRSTARIVSQVLRVDRPKARIPPRPPLKDRVF